MLSQARFADSSDSEDDDADTSGPLGREGWVLALESLQHRIDGGLIDVPIITELLYERIVETLRDAESEVSDEPQSERLFGRRY